MRTSPLVSVLITVYNGMPLLRKVIDHLLNQTYKDFEIIVVDDASSDDSVAYLNSVQDPRLKLFSDGKLGRGKALNFGLSKCSGKYVAVNDADDLSLPDRLRQQVEFLEANPDYGLVGSNFIKSFSESEQEYTNKSLDNDSLRTELSLHSCIQHSAVLFRKSVMDQIGGYNLKIKYLYDRDIYIRVAEISKIANLPEHLVIINRHENQFFNKTFKGFERQLFSLKYSFIAIQKLKLPKYLYIKRTLKFIYSAVLNLIKWKK
jgi:glycosyltransferase involved in cell wall biosynthesis